MWFWKLFNTFEPKPLPLQLIETIRLSTNFRLLLACLQFHIFSFPKSRCLFLAYIYFDVHIYIPDFFENQIFQAACNWHIAWLLVFVNLFWDHILPCWIVHACEKSCEQNSLTLLFNINCKDNYESYVNKGSIFYETFSRLIVYVLYIISVKLRFKNFKHKSDEIYPFYNFSTINDQ